MVRRRIRPAVRTAQALLLAGLASLLLASPAAAHARLDHTVPPSGARLQTAPPKVELVFGEGVQVSPHGVQLSHADGSVIPGVVAAADGQDVTADVPTGLPAGIYVVRWRVLSDDGHVVHGAFAFTVGVVTGTGVPTADDGGDPGGTALMAREVAEWVADLGMALAAGGLALWLVTGIVDPRRQVLLGSAFGVVAAVVALVSVKAQTDGGWGGSTALDGWQQVVRTPSGQALLLRLVAAGAVAALVLSGRRRGALAAAVLGAVAVPLAGHATTDPSPVLAVPLLAAHVLAAAIWSGGLVALLPLLRPTRRSDLVAALPAAGGLATGSVAALVLTGVVAGWRRLPDPAALTGTGYGVLLIVKAALLTGLLVLGSAGWRAARAAHRPAASSDGVVGSGPAVAARVTVLAPPTAPAPARDGIRVDLLRRTVHVEVLLLAAALSVAAVLSSLAPPSGATAGSTSSTRQRSLTTADGGHVLVTLHQGSASLGVDLAVTAADGTPEDAVAVVAAAPAGTVIPPTDLPLQRLAAGRFTADPVPVSPSGRWDVTVGLVHADGRPDTLHVSADVP
jgi:copper transport protein